MRLAGRCSHPQAPHRGSLSAPAAVAARKTSALPSPTQADPPVAAYSERRPDCWPEPAPEQPRSSSQLCSSIQVRADQEGRQLSECACGREKPPWLRLLAGRIVPWPTSGSGHYTVFFFGGLGMVVSPALPNRALAGGKRTGDDAPRACEKSGPISGATISKRQGLGGKVRVGDARCRSGNRTGKREFVENHGRE